METKQFQVGQVWKSRCGALRKINLVGTEERFNIYSTNMHDAEFLSHERNGGYYGVGEHDYDLVELVTNADGTPAADVPTNEGETLGKIELVEGQLLDDSRTQFIDKLTHDMFIKFVEQGWSSEGIAQVLRAAVKVRDELVDGKTAE